ncbi:MAG: diacylglycerol kinase family protein [Clostridia bacterium]|nr:diacylglycerol kinase family protein [Clostridia bacterium]
MKLENKEEIKTETKKIVNSFKYALEGIKSSFGTERNMKIHIIIMLFVILVGVLLKISVYEWLICIVLFGMVIAGELFNTAIETVVDIAMPEKNEKAKIAKDISAGAVLVLSIVSAVIGIIIFVPKILYIILK